MNERKFGRWIGVSCRSSVPCRTGCPYSRQPLQMHLRELAGTSTDSGHDCGSSDCSLVSAVACTRADPGLALLLDPP